MKKNRVLIIAEISANHGQNLKSALKLIKEAKKSGADAVKFQTYTPDTITFDSDKKYFRINHTKWKGQTLYDLYKKAYTPWGWFKKLKAAAKDSGLMFFSTAFDRTAVDLLESLHVPVHKIASFELTDIPLIRYMASTGKPIIISTGMGTLEEIKEAVKTAREAGTKDITLMKCVSNYPANAEDMNLLTIPDMRKRFKCKVGLSDHTRGIGVSVASVALGACMVEKHFTISRKDKTPDSFFSAEPDEFSLMSESIREAEKAMGKVEYSLSGKEKKNRVFRRSVFSVAEIKKGETLTAENIRCLRPSYGAHPRDYKKLLGKKAAKNISAGTPMDFKMVL